MSGAAVAALLVVAASAVNVAPAGAAKRCGGTVNAKNGRATVTARDFCFAPTTIKVAEGVSSLTVRFRNRGAAQHTFTTTDGSADKTAAPGATVTISNVAIDPSDPSGNAFFCKFHGQMRGIIAILIG